MIKSSIRDFRVTYARMADQAIVTRAELAVTDRGPRLTFGQRLSFIQLKSRFLAQIGVPIRFRF